MSNELRTALVKSVTDNNNMVAFQLLLKDRAILPNTRGRKPRNTVYLHI